MQGHPPIVAGCLDDVRPQFLGWGQEGYYITTQGGKKFPQENVPTLVDTIYVEKDKGRRLVVPNTRDYYYVRWYQKNGDGRGSNITNLSKTSLRSELRESSGNNGSQPSFFWHHGMSRNDNRGERVFSINYTAPGNLSEDSVFCDLSFNVDGSGIVNENIRSYEEPTLGKRYKFYIKNADDMKERLKDVTGGEALETIRITVPQGATGVNLQMDMAPENYYWDSYKGDRFSIEGYTGASSDGGKLISLEGSINEEKIIMVYAQDGRIKSPCLAKFILTPQKDSGFKTEEEIKNTVERNPGKYPQKYAEIGVVDFDYGETVPRNGPDELSADNNMRKEPVDPSRTTYSFMDPDLPSIYNRNEIPEDAYGLYRSANVEGISKSSSNGESWAKSYYPSNYGGYNETNKTYGWYYTKEGVLQTVRNRELYDRTYYNSNHERCGYFYYVNASKEAGRVTTIPIDGLLCANTELTVVAWVANITDISTSPNVSLVLRGEDPVKGLSGVIHHFSSGEMTTRTDNDRAIWKQLCYKITLSKEQLSSYTDFFVEFRNNTPDSDGGDYAIDDIRIYKTLPDISIRRKEACESSTLVVSSDYHTLMRNMGWHENSDVLANVSLTDSQVRKYRYGIMGDDPHAMNPHVHTGNVYYSITETNLDEYDGKGPTGDNPEDWVTLNKELFQKGEEAGKSDATIEAILKGLSKTMRVAIPTDLDEELGDQEHEGVPVDSDMAMEYEFTLNIRALNDFIADIKGRDVTQEDGTTGEMKFWQNFDKNVLKTIEGYMSSFCTIRGGAPGTGAVEVNEEHIKDLSDTNSDARQKYEYCLMAMYSYLQIPRIHCPWEEKNIVTGDKILCLGVIDVNNTDLKFKNEIIDDGIKATGEYHVVIFNAEHVYGQSASGGSQNVVQFSDKCLLHSPFTVQPAIDLALETDMFHDGSGCLNNITNIRADLMVEEFDEFGNIKEELVKFEDIFKGHSYTFDWFMGTEVEYVEISQQVSPKWSKDLQILIGGFRASMQGDKTARFSKAAVETSQFAKDNPDDAELLISLLESAENTPRLVVGNGMKYSQILWTKNVVAMAYVPDIKEEEGATEDGRIYRFCTKPIYKELVVNGTPDLITGFPTINYPADMLTSAPLRLGLENIKGGATLQGIPIRGDKIVFGSDGDSLSDPYIRTDETEVKTVYFYEESSATYRRVGLLNHLSANKIDGGALSFTFDDDVDTYFKEGETYTLLIPIGEYKGGQQIEGSCGGYAQLQIKVVPKYLTWTGSDTDPWYQDGGKWQMSTKTELNGATANEEDTPTFSPLYFTKVTIADDRMLSLKSEESGVDTNDNIKYDMAVDKTGSNDALTVVPYYGNKVNEIYFKPGAKLVNQHLLDYEKAWVDFYMTKGQSYWMASPLEGVYAGDMYAPYKTGKENTAAFTPIKFNNEVNNRWDLPFYQKAWNKAIAYVNSGTDHNAANAVDVAAVQSNWSIEYNDVWVPYTIGRGFYMRVEGKEATVRLPKADPSYSYQPAMTRSGDNLSKPGNRDNAGKMAGAEVTIDLTSVDGDGTHFLVGNPYMTYLDMEVFLRENTAVLEPKYWTLENKVPNAVVGTPDVLFDNASVAGTIEPMRAFFVEKKKEVTGSSIKFTADMMSETSKAASGATTKSTSATNPVLTLTADRGDIKSVATLRTSDKADNAYKADEDAVVLLDSELDAPMVYTVAGSQAAQVNAVKSIKNIGLGVFNEGGDEVTVTIEGLSRMAETLYLYDAQTRKSVKLDSDSYSLTLSGDSHGRYYLRDSALGSELENTISIYSAQRGQVIVSALRPVKDIKVFGLNGSLARQFSVNTTQYSFDLPAGIYMIYASDGEQEYTEKVIVR